MVDSFVHVTQSLVHPSIITFQEEVLQESKMMIPDCLRKLKDAHAKLSALLEEAHELHETAEYTAAKEQLEQTQSIVSS